MSNEEIAKEISGQRGNIVLGVGQSYPFPITGIAPLDSGTTFSTTKPTGGRVHQNAEDISGKKLLQALPLVADSVTCVSGELLVYLK